MWITSHIDATKFVRVAELRALHQVGKDYSSKLQGLSKRVQMPEIGEIRTRLSETLNKMKNAEKDMVKRASKLWDAKLRSDNDVDNLLSEVEALNSAFENCPLDLEDLQLMRQALRIYQRDFQQLNDDRLSWAEFNELACNFKSEAESSLGEEEIPWSPEVVIDEFTKIISKNRKEKSRSWIESIETGAVSLESMTVIDVNRLHARASSPPAVLAESDTKRLEELVKKIEIRLDNLKLDWLVEKFKELPLAMRQKFMDIISMDNDG